MPVRLSPDPRPARPVAHPGLSDLLALVRGALCRDRERQVLNHSFCCPSCMRIVRVLIRVREAHGVAVRQGLERIGASGPIH